MWNLQQKDGLCNLIYYRSIVGTRFCCRNHSAPQCLLFRPTIIVPENKTGFFNTLTGFFSWGRWKTSPAPSMSCWSIFERNLVGLADFAGSKFQRMANWPSFDFFIEAGWTARNRPPVSYHSPSFDFLSKLGQLAIRRNSSLQNRPIPLESSRKLTGTHWESRGRFFNVPGTKNLSRCWKILFCFRER